MPKSRSQLTVGRVGRWVLALVVCALIWAVGQHFVVHPDSGRSFGGDVLEGIVFVLVVWAVTPLVGRLMVWWKARSTRR